MTRPPADPVRVPFRVLLVDDEEPILYAMKEYFGAIGCEVDCAREKEEAEALLSNVRYAAAIVDLQLTVTHGAEGLDIIGTVHERCPWTKVIVLTAHGSPEMEQEVLERGGDAFLRKPTPLRHVADVMFSLMEGRT